LPSGLTFTAVFSLASGSTFSITASADSYSNINPVGVSWYAPGANATFTFYSLPSYNITGLAIDGIAETSGWTGNATYGTYTFTDIQSNHVISVVALPQGIDFLVTGPGTLSWTVVTQPSLGDTGVSGGVGFYSQFKVDDVVEVTGIPNTGAYIVDVQINGGVVSSNPSSDTMDFTYNLGGTVEIDFSLISTTPTPNVTSIGTDELITLFLPLVIFGVLPLVGAIYAGFAGLMIGWNAAGIIVVLGILGAGYFWIIFVVILTDVVALYMRPKIETVPSKMSQG
jgi:hypothetical protein